MKISYKVSGRFGNNFFQYIATKIIQKELVKNNKSVEYVFDSPLEDAFIITDSNYFQVLNNISSICNENVYLDGYFQFDEHIIKNKDYINSVINSYNNEKINSNVNVSFLTTKLKETLYLYKDEDVVLHIRLDDFIGDRLVMKPEMYIDIISTLKEGSNIIIVIDKIKYSWEAEYIRMIYEYATKVKGFTVSISSDDMFKDFCKLYYAPNLISSNSTFSYLAGLLGTHNNSWCPVNTIYSHQKISKFDENTVSKKVEYL